MLPAKRVLVMKMSMEKRVSLRLKKTMKQILMATAANRESNKENCSNQRENSKSAENNSRKKDNNADKMKQSLTSGKSRKRGRSDQMDGVEDAILGMFNLQKQCMAEHKTDDNLFFESCCLRMKKLPQQLRGWVQLQISHIFYKAESRQVGSTDQVAHMGSSVDHMYQPYTAPSETRHLGYSDLGGIRPRSDPTEGTGWTS